MQAVSPAQNIRQGTVWAMQGCPHLLLGYLGSRLCLSVFGLWKTTLYRGFLSFLKVLFFTALRAFCALALGSVFPPPAPGASRAAWEQYQQQCPTPMPRLRSARAGAANTLREQASRTPQQWPVLPQSPLLLVYINLCCAPKAGTGRQYRPPHTSASPFQRSATHHEASTFTA